MTAFYIHNHSTTELRKAELSTLPTLSARPSFANKDAFAAWCHDINTKHVFYVLGEPEFPSMRSSSANAVKFLHGVIADYDGAADAIQAALPKLKFEAGKAPTYVTTTFSGKARLIWAFERPVPVFTPDVLARFLGILLKELKLKSLLPGLDEVAWANPHTPYELGTDWRQPFGDVRLSSSITTTAIHDASAKAKWRTDGPEIPLDAVAAEVERRFPGRWTGPFVEGARGVRFWDAKADNLTGCTVRTTGVQAWTGEAKFMPWAEVLGAEFVNGYRQNRISSAVDGSYYDGQAYWEKDAEGTWQSFTGAQMERRLGTEHGLSNEARRGTRSECAHAMSFIENARRVDGAFPCLYLPDTVVRDRTDKYLNIARIKVHPGAGQPRSWGDGFPFIAAYLDGLFDEKQRDVFLSWLGHFYQSAAAGKPRKGHALFVAGDVGSGKTLLSQHLIGGLMGGFAEATSFIVGTTHFNEMLFHKPIWAVDDGEICSDPKRHASYSALVKKIVANPYQEFHPKFRKAVTFRYNGRLIITLNTDPNSIGMLPELEGSIRDKLVILKANRPAISFAGCEAKIAAELSAFADFVGAWVIPAWLQQRPAETDRFGHDSWLHPDLVEIASDASPSASLRDLLDRWRTYHFRTVNDTRWVGNAFDLLVALDDCEPIKAQLPRVAHRDQYIKKHLNHIIQSRIADWVTSWRTNAKRGFAIDRPTDLPVK